jgi:hypothetical protein
MYVPAKASRGIILEVALLFLLYIPNWLQLPPLSYPQTVYVPFLTSYLVFLLCLAGRPCVSAYFSWRERGMEPIEMTAKTWFSFNIIPLRRSLTFVAYIPWYGIPVKIFEQKSTILSAKKTQTNLSNNDQVRKLVKKIPQRGIATRVKSISSLEILSFYYERDLFLIHIVIAVRRNF